MNFSLKKPCAKCPFRVDCRAGWLGEQRADEIADTLMRQHTFACHETTEFDEQHCAGAMIMLERLEAPNQMMRIAERLGLYDRAGLNMDADVFEDLESFVIHHAED